MNFKDSKMHEIRQSLDAIANRADTTVNESENRLTVTGTNFTVEVLVELDWIGIKFNTINLSEENSFSWFTDTDNYPISRSGHEWFREAIADDIVIFLQALLNGGIYTAKDKRGLSTIIPDNEGYVKTKKTLIGWISKHYFDLEEAKAGLKYESFVI